MAYIVMAYIVMAYIVMAYIVMAYIVIAYNIGLQGGKRGRKANGWQRHQSLPSAPLPSHAHVDAHIRPIPLEGPSTDVSHAALPFRFG